MQSTELSKNGGTTEQRHWRTRAKPLRDSSRPYLVLIYRHHRPVQARRLAARTGRCLKEFCEAHVILTSLSSRLKPPVNIFSDHPKNDAA